MHPVFKIKVGQDTYVVVTDNSERENDRCAATYHQLSRIQISPALSDSAYRSTLFHEVMHTVAHYVGVADEEKLDEESWINRTASAFLTVLKENPLLLKELEIFK